MTRAAMQASSEQLCVRFPAYQVGIEPDMLWDIVGYGGISIYFCI